MGPNHGQRRALGRGVYALAACAVAGIAGLGMGVSASGALGGTSAPVLTSFALTSIGSDGAAATSPNARAAISASGQYVAFQSQATLNVSGSVPTPPPPPPPPTATTKPKKPAASKAPVALAPANFRVYVRDRAGNVTSLLSNPNTGNATAPTITGTGKLVSYLFESDFENNVVVVNRQATGSGAFDTPANLTVQTVTGTSNDLQFERIPGCSPGIGKAGAIRTTPCGPKLSADGTTLAYPAQLSPISPSLAVTQFEGSTIPGNVVDFGETSPAFDPSSEFVSYTVSGNNPLTLTGVTASAPFTVDPAADGCVGTFAPGASCNVSVSFDTSNCPASGTAVIGGTLKTGSTVPDGQSSLGLVVFCNADLRGDAARRPAACAAAPKGVPVFTAPATEPDDSETPLVDFGVSLIGQPYAEIVNFTALPNTPIELQSPDCGFQLVDPASIGQPAGDPIQCSTAGEGADFETCKAYVLVTPGTVGTPATVGTDVAGLIEVVPDCPSCTQVATYLSTTSLSDVVIARHDKTGAGNFAASPSTVVSVDGTGTPIPDASQPSVSATGRYVAFTAAAPTGALADSTEVYRHDTDAAGDRTYHPGATDTVSCLAEGEVGFCVAADDADSPSISGDGSQVAFATVAVVDGEVYVRNVTAGTSTLVSATSPSDGMANGISYAPAMSQDGSTVAYISTATNLAAPPAPAGAANLYVRTLTSSAPIGSELAAPSGTSLPAGDDIALPAIDADGGQVAFQTSQRLSTAAPPTVTSIYTFGSEPELAFSPAPVNFGTLVRGSAAGSITVTVTNIGPGPGTVLTAGTTPPFGIAIGTCAGAVLHEGDSCVVTVSLVPDNPGTDNGTLTATVTDDSGSPLSFSEPITATVVIITPPHHEKARITLNPGVAPAGQVTDVTGTGFLAGQHVTLSWNLGLGQVKVVADGSGDLTAVMVIFPDDYTGPRVLQARDLSGTVLATAKFLVQQPIIWPPIGAGKAQG